MNNHTLVYSYFGEDIGFKNDYVLALSFILSHHSFIAALGDKKAKVQLITDADGKEFIVNKLGICFDDVKIIDKPMDNKIQILDKISDRHFVYIDIDTYLLKTFPIRVFGSDVFCTYIQRNNKSDVDAFNAAYLCLDESDVLMTEIRGYDSIWSIDSSIIGSGSSPFSFWKQYSEYSKKIKFNKNNEAVKIVIENVLPYYFFRHICVELDVIVDRNKETEFEMFHHQLANLNLIRLSGKTNPFMIEAIEKFVKNYYPDSYKKIEGLK